VKWLVSARAALCRWLGGLPYRLVGRVRQSRRPVCVVIAWGLAWLSGCATLPDVSERPAEHVRAAAHDSPLGRLAEASVSDPSLSGFRLISSGHVSLQIRLKLIEGAQSSIDVQTYQFRGDRSGFLIMRALRDAAARGVRVRVLVDDLYTDGDDLLRLSLAARDGVDVRLFNPFSFGRDSIALRMVGALFGDERLHRRMHNKLMVVDGVLAVLGGRNISDEYFDTQGDQAFYDFDVLVAGEVVPQVAVTFDPYWNSRYSHDARVVLGESAAGPSSRASSAREPVEPCNPLICAPASAPAEDEQLAGRTAGVERLRTRAGRRARGHAHRIRSRSGRPAREGQRIERRGARRAARRCRGSHARRDGDS
jgi:phosphatidylserine/phosphatidylglycerophosphate/cardiolipin synthase-like enzyme